MTPARSRSDRRRKNYAWFDRNVTKLASQMIPGASSVYNCICAHADANGKCRLSREKIAEESEASLRQIHRILFGYEKGAEIKGGKKSLQELGLISVETTSKDRYDITILEMRRAEPAAEPLPVCQERCQSADFVASQATHHERACSNEHVLTSIQNDHVLNDVVVVAGVGADSPEPDPKRDGGQQQQNANTKRPNPHLLSGAVCEASGVDPIHHSRKMAEWLREATEAHDAAGHTDAQIRRAGRAWREKNGRFPLPVQLVNYWPAVMAQDRSPPAKVAEIVTETRAMTPGEREEARRRSRDELRRVREERKERPP